MGERDHAFMAALACLVRQATLPFFNRADELAKGDHLVVKKAAMIIVAGLALATAGIQSPAMARGGGGGGGHGGGGGGHGGGGFGGGGHMGGGGGHFGGGHFGGGGFGHHGGHFGHFGRGFGGGDWAWGGYGYDDDCYYSRYRGYVCDYY
jgi:hypothetical protein